MYIWAVLFMAEKNYYLLIAKLSMIQNNVSIKKYSKNGKLCVHKNIVLNITNNIYIYITTQLISSFCE